MVKIKKYNTCEVICPNCKNTLEFTPLDMYDGLGNIGGCYMMCWYIECCVCRNDININREMEDKYETRCNRNIK